MSVTAVLRSRPTVEIVVPLEGLPVVRLCAETAEDEGRLLDWMRGRPRVIALLGDALTEIETGLDIG